MYLQHERNVSSWDVLLGADLETIRELIIDYQPSYETKTRELDDFINCIPPLSSPLSLPLQFPLPSFSLSFLFFICYVIVLD